MPSKRTRVARPLHSRLTDEVLRAYQAADYFALHRALQLPPWHLSPLPLSRDPLGVDPDDPPDPDDVTLGAQSWADAVAWQEAIEAALAERDRAQ
jgi:hypothetical protein